MSWIGDVGQHLQSISPNWVNTHAIPGSAQAWVNALANDDWTNPFSGKASSWDMMAGGSSSEDPRIRTVGRAVGSYFLGGAVANGAGGAEAGAGTVGAEEAGVAADAGAATDAAMEANNADVISQFGGDSSAAAGAGSDAAQQIVAGESADLAAGNTSAQNIVGSQPTAGSPEQLGGPGMEEWNAAREAANKPGLIEGAMKTINANPAASVLGFKAVEGVGSAALASRAAEKKRKADLERELELADFKRKQTQANPSVGGGGVNLNLRPTNAPIRRPDGTLVYPVPGLINRAAGGVRG
jgi:hypothetical protein